ncbi:hypothetical protein BJ122_11981 [Rhodopseudomonas faecalis]|uniref:Uncharacterized protein n=1 Tax=Rhodopseudomonas faecalis TaxID=99655 RepID=A0A318TAE5_9BRAD|nr:hypothetical protein BJ122_11981 [Rhodopseudomonas faecalis]
MERSCFVIAPQQEDYLNTRTPKQTRPRRRGNDDKRQLAAFSNILGLMMAATRLSEELYALSDEIGGSLEEVAEIAGVPFFEIHNAYAQQTARHEKRGSSKKPAKAPKRSRAA